MFEYQEALFDLDTLVSFSLTDHKEQVKKKLGGEIKSERKGGQSRKRERGVEGGVWGEMN